MQVGRRYQENAEESRMPRNMPRNWAWNFNPNPVGEKDEVNGALIARRGLCQGKIKEKVNGRS